MCIENLLIAAKTLEKATHENPLEITSNRDLRYNLFYADGKIANIYLAPFVEASKSSQYYDTIRILCLCHAVQFGAKCVLLSSRVMMSFDVLQNNLEDMLTLYKRYVLQNSVDRLYETVAGSKSGNIELFNEMKLTLAEINERIEYIAHCVEAGQTNKLKDKAQTALINKAVSDIADTIKRVAGNIESGSVISSIISNIMSCSF